MTTKLERFALVYQAGKEAGKSDEVLKRETGYLLGSGYNLMVYRARKKGLLDGLGPDLPTDSDPLGALDRVPSGRESMMEGIAQGIKAGVKLPKVRRRKASQGITEETGELAGPGILPERMPVFPPAPILTVEAAIKQTNGEDGREGAYLVCLIDEQVAIKVTTPSDPKELIRVNVKVTTRRAEYALLFRRRYGGKLHKEEPQIKGAPLTVYTLTLTEFDIGMHTLLVDVAKNSRMYAKVGRLLVPVIENLFYLQEAKRLYHEGMNAQETRPPAETSQG